MVFFTKFKQWLYTCCEQNCPREQYRIEDHRHGFGES